MTQGSSEEPHPKPKRSERLKASRDQLRSQVQARRADIERHVHQTRAQLDATNERIEARTGRNLILAILIGLVIGVAVLASLIFIKDLFLVLGTFALAFSGIELASALRIAHRHVSRAAVAIAAVVIAPVTFYLGPVYQWLAFIGVLLLVTVWRIAVDRSVRAKERESSLGKDIVAGILTVAYVPFLGSFAVLLASQEDGQWWTLAFIILVIATDTGAYATGLTLGKHPMAPVISPKKTWEGFAGAGVASVIAGILLAVFMLHEPWWEGVVFAVVILAVATLGDLAESLIKRDIGIKDMSSWLPGHGGFLDRLDSILPSALAAYVLYVIFA